MSQLLTSPLLARVQRHAQMATLFRRPTWSAPINAETGGAVAVTLSAPQTVQATKDEVIQQMPVLPHQDRAAGLARGSVSATSASADLPSALAVPALAPPSVVPSSGPAALPVPPGQLPARPVATASAPAEPEDDPLDAAVWSRLQTIMRKHQEKQANEPTPDPTAPSMAAASPAAGQSAPARRASASTAPTGIQRQPMPQPAERATLPLERRRAAVTYVTDRERKSAPEAVQPLPVAESAASTPAHSPANLASGASSVLQRQATPEAVHADSRITATIAAPQQAVAPVALTGSPAPEQPQPTFDEAVLVDSAAELPNNSLSVASATDEHAQPESTTVRMGNSGQPTAFAPTTPPAMRQLAQEGGVASDAASLPLEAVWPVEQQAVARSPITPVPTSLMAEPGPLRTTASADVAVVQRALQHVQTGQPTASPVELIVPRRPRPGNIPTRQSAQPLVGSTGLAERLAPRNEEQRQRAAPNAIPGEIQTEIGPLPADLWSAIDEPMPVQRSSHPPANPAAPIKVEPNEPLLTPSIQRAVSNNPQMAAATPRSNVEGAATAARPEVHLATEPLAATTLWQSTQPTSLVQPSPVEAAPTSLAARSWDRAPFPQPDVPNRPAQPVIVQRTAGSLPDEDPAPFKPKLREQASPPQARSVDNRQVAEPAIATISRAQQPTAELSVTNTAVQRQADQAAAADEPSSNPAAVADAPPKTEPAACEINTDELARRVYAELKRRLTIEWERLRGR